MADEVDNRPNSQKDLELRLKAGHDPKKFAALLAERDGLADGGPVSYAVEGNDTSSYIGVGHEYATYSTDNEKPLRGDGGPEEDAVDLLTTPLRVNRIEVPVEASTIVGTGSTDPVVYSETSGEVWKTEVLTGEATPTTVKDVEALEVTDDEGNKKATLEVKDAEGAGAVLGTQVKPSDAGNNPEPQGAESAGKTTVTPPQPTATPDAKNRPAK
jgi:hypothetical protein